MSGWILYSSPWALAEDTEQSFLHGAGRPLTAKQLLTSNNVSPPVAAEALYGALDDLMARAGGPDLRAQVGNQHLPAFGALLPSAQPNVSALCGCKAATQP